MIMAQVDSKNTIAAPVDQTRRRFLSRRGRWERRSSAAAAAPVAMLDGAKASPALSAAARALDDAGETWKIAKAAFDAEDLKAVEWREANPEPKNRRAQKKYWARWHKHHDRSGIHAKWEARLEAEKAFSAALVAVGRLAPRDME
jgi:hypothetical protein